MRTRWSWPRHVRVASMMVMMAAGGGACGGGDAAGVTPPRPDVATVQVTPATASVVVGSTTPLTAAARDAAGATLTGRTIGWASSADGVARVDANGVVTGVAAGTVTITATSEGRTGQSVVTVQAPTPVPVASVVVTPPTARLVVGDTAALAAVVRDAQGAVLAGRVVRWSTSAPAVATVDSVRGVVRGSGAGIATITATSEGQSAQATITVSAAQAAQAPVASVRVGGAALDTLEAFDVVTLQATLRDSAGAVLTGRPVRWTVSDPAVATIDSATGRLTGVDRGAVTVTATSEGRSGTATRVVVIRYRSITAGTMHSCNLASGGIAWCWGLAGREGRLGDGRTGDGVQSSAPVRVSGSLRFAQLATYARHTCGLTLEGEAYCWGYNGWGELGAGQNVDQLPTPVAVAGGRRFRTLTVGAEHACAITADERAFCWGRNDDGELGTGVANGPSTPNATALVPVTAIGAGSNLTCAIGAASAASCWGWNGSGELGGGAATASLRNSASPVPVAGGLAFAAVSAGHQYACGVTTAGRGYCWGLSGDVLGFEQRTSSNVTAPTPIDGALTLRTVDAGYAHTCALATDAQLWCWGSNRHGQLGAAVAGRTARPVRAGGALTFAEVSVAGIATGSGSHTCAIAADRLTTYCWGLNDVGQLGNGTRAPDGVINATPSVVQGQRPLPATAAR